MRTSKQVARFAHQQLSPMLHLSGEVLYSAASTLRPGEVYLLGHNPGGDARNPNLPTVGGSLDELPTKTINSYLDTLWGGRWEGQAPLQRRVIWLLERLGLDPREVAASNLIFPRSRDAAGSEFHKFATMCWPVHEQILGIVRPQLVIVYGNSGQSPYRFLFKQFAAGTDKCYPSGHGDWVCRTFVAPGRFRVVGVPHMSRYDISAHNAVATWIKRLPRPRCTC